MIFNTEAQSPSSGLLRHRLVCKNSGCNRFSVLRLPFLTLMALLIPGGVLAKQVPHLDCEIHTLNATVAPVGFVHRETCMDSSNNQKSLSYFTERSLHLPNVCAYTRLAFIPADEIEAVPLTRHATKVGSDICPEYGSSSYTTMTGFSAWSESLSVETYSTIFGLFSKAHESEQSFDKQFSTSSWFRKIFYGYKRFQKDFLSSSWSNASITGIHTDEGPWSRVVTTVKIVTDGGTYTVNLYWGDSTNEYLFMSASMEK